MIGRSLLLAPCFPAALGSQLHHRGPRAPGMRGHDLLRFVETLPDRLYLQPLAGENQKHLAAVSHAMSFTPYRRKRHSTLAIDLTGE